MRRTGAVRCLGDVVAGGQVHIAVATPSTPRADKSADLSAEICTNEEPGWEKPAAPRRIIGRAFFAPRRRDAAAVPDH